jgi:hypothetical protein
VIGAPPGLNTISPTNKLLGLRYVNAITEWTYLVNLFYNEMMRDVSQTKLLHSADKGYSRNMSWVLH